MVLLAFLVISGKIPNKSVYDYDHKCGKTLHWLSITIVKHNIAIISIIQQKDAAPIYILTNN